MIPFHLPREAGQTRLFDPSGGVNLWTPYTIPDGAVALNFLVVGGGGGGGAGHTRAAAAAGGGGGGGGSGCISRLFVPTHYLPKTLYVQAGIGGAQGVAGGSSFVSVSGAANSASHHICQAAGGGFGGTGTGAAAGGGGAGGTATVSGAYGALGVFLSVAGVAGAVGGAIAGAFGPAVTFGSANVFLTGGAGGAGTTSADFNGGNVNAGGLVPSLLGQAGSIPASSGFEMWVPPSFTGGCGGGSRNAGTGAAGGNGGRGCGGGGGGAGTTGGTGGRGGNGFVMITAVF